jgi:hypothetical protein
MTFWSANNVEPTRQYRFIISTNSDVWWWAKSCDKPSFDIESQEHKLINHKFKYPGVVTWNDVKITIVDVGEKANELIKSLKDSGYYYPSDVSSGADGLTKFKANNAYTEGTNILISQMDSEGVAIEEWELKNAWVKAITFGSLDYSNDEMVTIDITFVYDWASFSAPNVDT